MTSATRLGGARAIMAERTGGETLVLTASDVDALLDMHDCIEAVGDAFGRWALGEVPPPSVLGVHVGGGGFHIKAAALRRDRHYFAAKTNANFPANPERHGLPSIQGVIVLCDADLGSPLAVLDSSRVTELRTAAATGVAARHLARVGTVTATLIGCGAQAASQLRALAAVRPLTRVWLFDQKRTRAEELAARMGPELGIAVDVGDDLAARVRASDICVTCTTARRAILGPDSVAPGTFVAAVGADSPEKQEIEPALLRASKVVADSLDQCSAIGELRHALEAGVMAREDVHAELGEVVAGLKPGRTDDEEVIVFDSTGTGLQDVACAALAYERALHSGRGTRIALAR